MFNKIIDSHIKEPIDRGNFDNLPNKGQRLDLTEYFNTPEELRVASPILKSAGVKPPEVELLCQITGLKNQLDKFEDNDNQAQIRKQIGTLQIEFNIAMERIQQQRRK